MKQLMFVWVVCLSLCACSTIDFFSIDTLMPSDVSFAPEVKRVAVLNNMVGLPEQGEGKADKRAPLLIDGRLVSEKLAEQVANANYFEQVVFSDSLLRKGKTLMQNLLTSQEVDSLAEDLQVDMLLVVDEASVHTGTALLQTEYSDGERLQYVYGALLLDTHLYLPGRDRPFQHFADRDTIYWETDGLTVEQVKEDATEYISRLPVHHIVPLWRMVERGYFRGGTVNMRDAAVAIQEGDWDLACESWKADYDSRKGKPRMRAAFNLALYYEMKGDIRKALSYVQEAKAIAAQRFKHKDTSLEWQMIKTYEEELQQQDMTRQKLDLQMHRFGR